MSDTRQASLESEPEPRIYHPVAQFSPRALTLVVRTSAPPAMIATAVRERLATLDPTVILCALLLQFLIRALALAHPVALAAATDPNRELNRVR